MADQKLESIFTSGGDRLAQYAQLVDEWVAAGQVDNLKTFITHLVSVGERNAVMISRPALRHFVSAVERLSNSNLEAVAKFTLEQVRPRSVYYAEESLPLARLLAEVYQADCNYLAGAKVMSQVDLSNARSVTPAFKAEWFCTVAEFYMAGKDTVNASTCVQLAHREMSEVQDPLVQLRFKNLYAMVCDAERRFLDAAIRYMEVSQMTHLINEADVMQALEKAVTCSILAKAGPSRSRIFAALYRDERASRLPNYRFLEKMYKERIFRAAEVEKFEETLLEHQRVTVGGVTVLKSAVNEHNMLAVSRIYNNITFQQLGSLLDLTPAKAEEVAWKMIQEGRLKAIIDQIEGIIEFENNTDSFNVWDSQIAGVCQAVNITLEKLQKKHPNYVLE